MQCPIINSIPQKSILRMHLLRRGSTVVDNEMICQVYNGVDIVGTSSANNTPTSKDRLNNALPERCLINGGILVATTSWPLARVSSA